MDAATQLTNAFQTYLGRPIGQDQLNWRLGRLSVTPLGQQLIDIRTSPEAQAFAANKSKTQNADLTAFANQQKADMDALLNRQNAQQDSLFGQYTSAVQGQEKLPDMYTRLSNELGLPGLGQQAQAFKDEIYNVKSLLDRLDEDVTSRTQGTMTTEAQRRAIIAKEGGDLETQLGRLGTGLAPIADLISSAQGQLGTMMGLTADQQDRELRPLELQINAMSDRFAREITGFTSNKETQLTALLDSIQRDRQLSDRDWQLAQDLAAEERNYAHQKALAKIQFSGGGGGGGGNPVPTQTYSYNDWAGGAATNGGLQGIPAFQMQSTPFNLGAALNSGGLTLL